MSPGDHVAECPEAFSEEHVFDGGENVSDFPAPLQDLIVLQFGLLPGAGYTGKWNFAAFQALHVARVFRGTDQFILATTHEIKQAIEELPDVGGAHKVLEAQIANTAPQIHPEIPLIEDAKKSVPPMQQSVTPRMKCAGLEPVDIGAFQFLPHARHHFRSGVVALTKRKNFVGARVTFADQISHALREDSGLPRAGAGDHQHRAMNVSDGLLLAFIVDDFRRE